MSSVHHRRALLGTLIAAALVAVSLATGGGTASAAQAPVGLGTAESFAVLAGSGITNTGPTTITGDVGTFPTTTETGLGSVTLTGTNHDGDAVTQQAKNDLVTAYNDAAGRGPTTQVATDLAGQTLVPGVYNSANGAFGNSGMLTLDGQDQTDPVFIFQTSSTLITSSASSVILENGANACDVYWQIGSSATLGTGAALQGTILALTSITLTTGATLVGRALAQNGAVTLDTNTITQASCSTTPTTTTSTSTTSTTTTPTTTVPPTTVPPTTTPTTTTVTSSTSPSTTGQPVTFTATVTAGNGSTPTGSVEFFDNGTPLGAVALDSGGQAVLATSALSPGSNSITAVYSGASGFSSSTSTALTQTVLGGGGTGNAATPIATSPTFTG